MTLTKHMLVHHARMRDEFAESSVATRERMGLPPANADDVMWAGAVDVVLDGCRRVDLLRAGTAVRSAKATVRRAEQKRQYEQLVEAAVVHLRRNRAHLAADAEMENRARVARREQRVDADDLMMRIAMQEVSSRMSAGPIASDDVRQLTARVRLRLAAPPPRSRTAPEREIRNGR